MKPHQISEVLTFLTERDKTKESPIFSTIKRYMEYKNLLSRYSYHNEDTRTPLSLLTEFIYQYASLNKLFTLSTNKKYAEMVKVTIRPIKIQHETDLLSYNYRFIKVSFKTPKVQAVFEWDDIDFQTKATIGKSATIFNRDEQNAMAKAAILRSITYFYDNLLRDYWDKDRSELNTHSFRIIGAYLNNIRCIQEYTERDDVAVIHPESADNIYLENNIYCYCLPITGYCAIVPMVHKWIYYKYNAVLNIHYESLTLNPLADIISQYVLSNRDDIESKIIDDLSTLTFWTSDLTL